MSRKAELGWVVLVLVLIFPFFVDLLILGRALYIRDVARIYYPERKVLRDVLLSGEFPFWNPQYAAGQPLAANPTWEVFYPPQWLVLLPDLRTAIAIEIVLHFFIAATGTFALLRSLHLKAEAAVFGALSFTLSGVMLSLASLLPCLFALAWVPWLGFALQRLGERDRPSDFVLPSLFLGIILLIGEPSTILQSAALAAAYLFVRLPPKRAIRAVAALFVVAFLVGAAQIIPALDHKRDSGRAAGMPYKQVSMQSMAPARPLELAAPDLFTRFTSNGIYFWGPIARENGPWMFSWYAGLLVATFCIAGFIRRIRGWKFVGAVAVISYLIALGKNGPLFPIIYHAGLRFIRYPEKWFMAASFLFIVFAAIAADVFLRDPTFRRTTFRVSIPIVVFHVCVLAFSYSPLFARVWKLSGYYADIVREARSGAMTMLAASVALVLILTLRERLRVAVPLLGLFVVADLGPRGYGLAPRVDRSFYDAPAIARMLPPEARIYNDADWRLVLLPQPHVGDRERWLRLRNAMLPEIQSMWGFASVLELDVTETMLKPTRELSAIFWRAQLSGDSKTVQRILADAGATYVIALRDATSGSDPVRVVALPGNKSWRIAGPARILTVRQTPNTLAFDVEATANAQLIVSVTRHRYWSATIDGAAATIHPANVAFQAIDVAPGRHRLFMRYRNPLVIVCGFVSLITIVALLAAHFITEHRRRRSDIERLDAA